MTFYRRRCLCGFDAVMKSLCVLFFPTTDVWTHFHDVLLPRYSQQLNGVNVMSGPIFDRDYDGKVDALTTLPA